MQKPLLASLRIHACLEFLLLGHGLLHSIEPTILAVMDMSHEYTARCTFVGTEGVNKNAKGKKSLLSSCDLSGIDSGIFRHFFQRSRNSFLFLATFKSHE